MGRATGRLRMLAVKERIRAQSPCLRDAERAGRIRIAGAVYAVRTG